MKARLALAFALGLTLSSSALAQTIIVNENFDGYADNAAMIAAWVPTIGNGTAAANAADADAGYLIGCASCAPITDPANYPGIEGQAADHISATASAPGQVNQFGGIINQPNGQNPAFQIAAPDETHNIVLSYDLFDSASGNERMSLGLRHVNAAVSPVATTNILEMGLYNSNSADPTVVGSANPAQNAVVGSPGFYNGRGYGARVINFGPAALPLTHQPDWQYFRTDDEDWGGKAGGDIGFAPEIDRTTDTDAFVTVGDVGDGWHTYTATITPTSVTITLDLFRDGVRNNMRDENGVVVGQGDVGVDAQMVFPIATNAAGFNSLRFGGPSGLLSAGTGFTAFDNILLQVVETTTPTDDADFDGDGDVDGADFLTWQQNLGISDGSATLAQGDANDDGNVTSADLDIWKDQFGDVAPPVGAIPEPATAALAAVAMLAGLVVARRR